jgi:SAM-dependent methyltransferase
MRPEDAWPKFGESRDDYCARQIPREAQSVLDVGCGPGTGLLRLRDTVRERVGVDVDAALIAIADELDPTADHRVVDGASLPFADGRFDAVILSEVLEHVGHENKVAIVDEAFRVLRPGGRLVVTSPHRGPIWRLDPLDFKRSLTGLYALYRRFRPGSPDTPAEVGHVPLTLGEVELLFQGRAELRGVGFGGPLYPLVALGNAILLMIGAPERWRRKYAWFQGVEVSIRVPQLFAHSIRVVADKRLVDSPEAPLRPTDVSSLMRSA